MTAWVMRFGDGSPAGAGVLRVGVKDAIDMAGLVTGAGCLPVMRQAKPAVTDAACLAGIRAAEADGSAVIVGKTTLTELCLSPTGVNPALGMPVNPLAPDRVPGGSSSGSAVAVAGDEADLALGTDTGGSVRIPAACCGIAGLKTTWGRIPTGGVWPLARSLDTVGPLARDVAGVVTGMRLLEPGWAPAAEPAQVVGRLRIPGVDPAIEAAIDAALAAAGLTVHSVSLPGWAGSAETFATVVLAEFWQAQQDLFNVAGVSTWVNAGLRAGSAITPQALALAYAAQQVWRDEVAALLDEVQLLALPTLTTQPAKLVDAKDFPATALTAPFNVSGSPALSLPVPALPVPALPVPALPALPTLALPVPPSLQLVGRWHSEDLLCATGLAIEAALR